MSSRRSEEYAIAAAVGLIILALGYLSGAFPWAILGGAVGAVVGFLVTRDLASAFSWGFATAAAILLLGIAALISPGWYKDLF